MRSQRMILVQFVLIFVVVNIYGAVMVTPVPAARLITILHPCAVHQRTEETPGISGSIMLFHCGLFLACSLSTLCMHMVYL